MDERWPSLELDAWRETYATLHMWTQVIGKIALALTARSNHFWNIAFLPSSRGLSTHPLAYEGRAITITFDFVSHKLLVHCSDGQTAAMPLRPQPVADFYREVMAALHSLGVDIRIWTMPVEIPNAIRFEQDTVHHSYDPEAAGRFWQAIVAMRPVFESFRARFIGKSSPVHFFWGSFDLASTRFSGRRAPERPGADLITRESYSHEVISHGFWPGGATMPEPVFYAYAAPEPSSFKAATVRPAAASYNQEFSEFLLPYDAVRRAASPSNELMAFLESTYEAGANAAGWDRQELERN